MRSGNCLVDAKVKGKRKHDQLIRYLSMLRQNIVKFRTTLGRASGTQASAPVCFTNGRALTFQGPQKTLHFVVEIGHSVF